MTRRRRTYALLAAVMVIAAGFVIGGGSPASGTEPPVFTLPAFPGDAGVLRLHMGADGDYFRFDASNGSGGYTAGTGESLVTSKCDVVAPLPTSVVLTPTPNGGTAQGKVGLVDHSLGVQVKGEGTGTPCGQVNGTSQALDLKLAGTISSRQMDYAELDVEGKYGVTVKAQLIRDGVVVRTEYLATGGPDSGPDSKDGDNFRWRLPSTDAGLVLFNEIKLMPDASTPGGALSLEGGSDGTLALPAPSLGATLGTTDSLFHVTNVDGTLTCGGSATQAGTGGAPSVTVTLMSTTGCEPVPYSLQTSNVDDVQAVAFQKPDTTNNVYKAVMTWPVEADAYPVPPTQIRYGSDPPHDLLWCGGTPDAPELLPNEPWCLADHHAVAAGDGLMQVTEVLYGTGDPGYWR